MRRLLVALLTALAGLALAPAHAPTAHAAPAGAAAFHAPGAGTAAPRVLTDSAAPARRAAPRCRGKRATLVGRPGRTLRGTQRRDVIVTNGADYVDAGRGDDLVCVTGGRDMQVQAGRGADVVVVRQRRGPVWAVLGSGADTFLGGPGQDEVYAAETDTGTNDRHRDVIRTRGGDDRAVTGRFDAASSDRVDLGGGDDEFWLYSTDNRRADFRGGRGEDRFVYMPDRVPDRAAEWVVDASAGTISDRGTTGTRFAGFDDYYLHSLAGASQHFIGTAADESFTPYPGGTVSASMGGGDDLIEIYHFADAALSTGAPGLDGGDGRDLVLMQEVARSAVGDLLAQRITVSLRDPGTSYDIALASIEDLALSSYETVTITGDDGPNRLWGFSCATRISGGGGDDVLRAEGFVEDIECASQPAELLGDAGDDTLVGGRHDDLLDGGDGTDSADGAKGTDTCIAETRVACEK